MDRKEIEGKIVKWAAEVSGEECALEMDIMDEVGLSSVELMELLASIEQAWGVRVTARDLRLVATVGDLAELVCKKKGI